MTSLFGLRRIRLASRLTAVSRHNELAKRRLLAAMEVPSRRYLISRASSPPLGRPRTGLAVFSYVLHARVPSLTPT